MESIEWRSISTQSIPPRLISEFLSPQIAHLSRLILPKPSTLVDCCLGWMAHHLQAFCMLLATHCHHILAVPSSPSNHRRPIAVRESPLPSPLPYYIDKSIIVVTMAVCTGGVLLFPQPTEHVAQHRCCRQPQRPQSSIDRYSLPSQHKADCYVERGQIVGNSLIGIFVVVIAPLSSRRRLLYAALSALPNPSASASTFCRAVAPHLFSWLLCCPVGGWSESLLELLR